MIENVNTNQNSSIHFFFLLFKSDIGLQNLQSLANISLITDFRAKFIEVMIISIKFSIKILYKVSSKRDISQRL